jgi:hypothetical protein
MPRKSKKTKQSRTKGTRKIGLKPQKKPSDAKVAKVLRRMRAERISLKRAARETKISPRTVKTRAASALRKNKSGRYTANPSDRLIRVLMIPTPGGREEVSIRGFSAASLLGSYWSALHLYYETGDDSVLQKFRGKFVTAVGGKKYPLLTDLEILNRLGSAGVVSFESLYSRSA